MLRRCSALEVVTGTWIVLVGGVLLFTAATSVPTAVSAVSLSNLVVVGLQTALVCLPVAVFVSVWSYWVGYYCYAHLRKSAWIVLSSLLLVYVGSEYALLVGWNTAVLPILRSFVSVIPVGGELVSTVNNVISLISFHVLRLTPIGALFVYLRFSGLDIEVLESARNHGISQRDIHWKILLPWVRGVLVLVGMFALIFSSLDALAPSVAANGTVQTIALLIQDWHNTYTARGAAASLGIMYLCGAVGVIYYAFRIFEGGENRGMKSVSDRLASGGWPRSIGKLSVVMYVLLELVVFFGIVYMASRGFQVSGLKESLSTMVASGDLVSALETSVWVSVISAVLATVLGTLSAVASYLRDDQDLESPRLRRIREVGLLLPILTPPILSGVYTGYSQGQFLGLFGSEITIIAAHVAIFGPLCYFAIMFGLNQLPEELSVAAVNLGVEETSFVSTVLVRNILGPLCVGALLVFGFSYNDTEIARHVGGFTKTLPVFLLEQRISSLQPQHYASIALTVIVTAVTMVGMLFLGVFAGRVGKDVS